MSKFLYKYYFMNEYSEKVIFDSELYFNIAKNFNDPFDMFIASDINNRIVGQRSGYVFSECECKKVSQLASRKMLLECGVLCLTEKWDNILMWSHYANNHKGICLEFNKEIINNFNDLGIQIKHGKVKYTTRRPTYSDSKPNDELHMAFFVKDKSWLYEAERRIVIKEHADLKFPKAINYDKHMLEGVLLGAKLSVSSFLDFYDKYKANDFKCNISFVRANMDIYKLDRISLNNKQLEYLYKNLRYLLELSTHTILASKFDEVPRCFKCYSDVVNQVAVSEILQYTSELFTLGKINFHEIDKPNDIYVKKFLLVLLMFTNNLNMG